MLTSRLHRSICVVALVADAATMLAIAFDWSGPLRIVAGLVFVCAVPGAAVMAHRSPSETSAQLTLVVALSLAIGALVNDVSAELAAWHPQATTIVIGVAAALSLVARLVREDLQAQEVAA